MRMRGLRRSDSEGEEIEEGMTVRIEWSEEGVTVKVSGLRKE